MTPKTRAMIVLGPMSFLCFIFATLSTFFFSAALQSYGDAGEEATTTMLVMLVLIALLPSVAVLGVVTGWRQLISESYGRAILLGLTPIVTIAIDAVVMQVGGFW